MMGKEFFLKNIFGILILSFTIVSIVNASDMASPSFIIRDPVIGTGSNYGNSTNFKLNTTGNISSSGIGSSPSFLTKYGFLYFGATESIVPIIPIVPGGGSTTTVKTGKEKASINFSGYAYPNATVTVLQNGQEKLSTLADNTGLFKINIEEKYDDSIIYTLFAKDTLKNKSLLLNYPVVAEIGYETNISNIRFTPTIFADKTGVRFGDNITISGYALPTTNLEIFIEGTAKKTFKIISSPDGSYRSILSLNDLKKENYLLYIKYTDDNRISKLLKFNIGETNIPNTDIVDNLPGDCNLDGNVNLTDFSVIAFWYNRKNPTICVDINKDSAVNLIDFSILAFWWTG